MKFLISMFLILFAGSLAQAVELRWLNSNESGCLLHMPVGYRTGDVTWYGKCPGKIADGRGMLRFSKTSEACEVNMVKGNITGVVACDVGGGKYITKFILGVPVRGWYEDDDRSIYFVEISDEGLITSNVITEKEANAFAAKNDPRENAAEERNYQNTDVNSPKQVTDNKLQTARSNNSSALSSVDRECPVEIKTWNMNMEGRGSTHGLKIFDLLRSVQNGRYGYYDISGWSYYFPFPKLSIAPPIRDIETLKKLNSSDWIALENAIGEGFRSTMQPDNLDAFRKNFSVIIDMVGCYSDQASKRENRSGRVSVRSNKSDAAKKDNQAQANTHAPFINRKCLDFTEPFKDGISNTFKEIKNRCGVPVEVIFCFFKGFEKSRYCGSFESGGVGWGQEAIEKGGTLRTADVITTPWLVEFFICDMSEGSKTCVAPKKDQQYLHQSDHSRN